MLSFHQPVSQHKDGLLWFALISGRRAESAVPAVHCRAKLIHIHQTSMLLCKVYHGTQSSLYATQSRLLTWLPSPWLLRRLYLLLTWKAFQCMVLFLAPIEIVQHGHCGHLGAHTLKLWHSTGCCAFQGEHTSSIPLLAIPRHNLLIWLDNPEQVFYFIPLHSVVPTSLFTLHYYCSFFFFLYSLPCL